MKDTKTINVIFKKSDMIDMYHLKIRERWNWEEMILKLTKFYLQHHPLEIPQEEEVINNG